MNQKILFSLVGVCLFSLNLLAQNEEDANTNDERQYSYLGLSTGINNIAGSFGLSAEMPFSEHGSLKVGVGIGGWGVKAGVAGKYYRNYPNSWGLGVGYSTAAGLKNFDFAPNNNSATKRTKVNLNRTHMMDLTIAKGWGKIVRFNFELGYSFLVEGATYQPVDRNIILSAESEESLARLIPGGFIIGVGLVFGL